MSQLMNTQKIQDNKNETGILLSGKNYSNGEVLNSKPSGNCTYAVTVSKKSDPEEEKSVCEAQRSFISIHSTDQLCQLSDVENKTNLEGCNVEILSHNEVFPSTSEESLDEDEPQVHGKRSRSKLNNTPMQKCQLEGSKTTYVPTNSKSTTGSRRLKESIAGLPSGYSDFDIPKSTIYVVGSNPGEPKISYADPPKKMSKTMKKLLRNVDKHKSEPSNKYGARSKGKLTNMRSILKEGRCGAECTGDSTVRPIDDYTSQYLPGDDVTLPYPMDFDPRKNCKYAKQNMSDKNVTFNTQVVIIHFTGDLCLGQSVEALSKEKDQQARNSELRKTFLTKYNEFWPTQK